MTHYLCLRYPCPQYLDDLLPIWIGYASARLECITLTMVDADLRGELDQVDWKALATILGAATQLKVVRFETWKFYDRIQRYIETLSVLAHHHFSVFVQISENPDSFQRLVV